MTGCCGGKGRGNRTTSPDSTVDTRGWIRIAYSGDVLVTIVSSRSGRSYSFEPNRKGRIQLVDPVDAPAILRRRTRFRLTDVTA
jgi:hypothetical protein